VFLAEHLNFNDPNEFVNGGFYDIYSKVTTGMFLFEAREHPASGYFQSPSAKVAARFRQPLYLSERKRLRINYSGAEPKRDWMTKPLKQAPGWRRHLLASLIPPPSNLDK
jgi:hypothetical protein